MSMLAHLGIGCSPRHAAAAAAHAGSHGTGDASKRGRGRRCGWTAGPTPTAAAAATAAVDIKGGLHEPCRRRAAYKRLRLAQHWLEPSELCAKGLRRRCGRRDRPRPLQGRRCGRCRGHVARVSKWTEKEEKKKRQHGECAREDSRMSSWPRPTCSSSLSRYLSYSRSLSDAQSQAKGQSTGRDPGRSCSAAPHGRVVHFAGCGGCQVHHQGLSVDRDHVRKD